MKMDACMNRFCEIRLRVVSDDCPFFSYLLKDRGEK